MNASRFTSLLRLTFCTLTAALAALPAQAQVAERTNPNFEYGVDRPGGDYRSFALQFDAPGLCAGQCAQEGQCVAWTYVKPGVQGPNARCWLKNVVPAPIRGAAYAVSGLRGTTAQPSAPPPPVTPATGAVSFVGCFKDTSDFDLNGHLERSAQNTPQRCVAVCQAKGFAYAGLQYGESCLCGNSYGRYGAASSCNMACTGDRGQACGGVNANSVFTTGITAARPPSPPPVAPVAGFGLTGRWNWNAVAYNFVQNGSSFTWAMIGNSEIGKGTVSGDSLQATWGLDGTGSSATGRVTQRSAAGDPVRLEWSNGVVMTRSPPR